MHSRETMRHLRVSGDAHPSLLLLPHFAGVVTMASRHLILVSLATAFLGLVHAAPVLGGDNSPAQWNHTSAAQYLDARGENWFKFSNATRGEGTTASQCVSCHSLLPYAFARPILRQVSHEHSPTRLETKILEQTKGRVANWDQLEEVEYQLLYDFDEPKKKQSRGTEAVLNALLLALDDRFGGRQQPSEATQKAFSILWATQIAEGQHRGSWEWLNFGLEPWESSDSRYLGATVAAIAIGPSQATTSAAPQPKRAERIDSLRTYLRTNYAKQNLHNRAWLLWASSGLRWPAEPRREESTHHATPCRATAWRWLELGALGDFTHVEIKTPITTPDGYATGLILHALPARRPSSRIRR